MKWVAAKNPFNRQQGTPRYAVFLYRFKSIGGTRWVVPAGREKMGRDGILIKPDTLQRYFFHRSKPALDNKNVNCSIRTAKPLFPAALCAAPVCGVSGYTSRITSQPPAIRGRKCRQASRPSRRARFRSTAFPKPREKVKQIRLRGRLFLSTNSFAPRQPKDLPRPKTARISLLFFRRSSPGKRKQPRAPLMGAVFVPTGRVLR